jgi:hypothetical protein
MKIWMLIFEAGHQMKIENLKQSCLTFIPGDCTISGPRSFPSQRILTIQHYQTAEELLQQGDQARDPQIALSASPIS